MEELAILKKVDIKQYKWAIEKKSHEEEIRKFKGWKAHYLVLRRS